MTVATGLLQVGQRSSGMVLGFTVFSACSICRSIIWTETTHLQSLRKITFSFRFENLFGSHTGQSLGQISPHKPAQGCPQSNNFLHGISHLLFSHSSEHTFVHFLCKHFIVQLSKQLTHSWEHLLLHRKPCEQIQSHFLEQGGQISLQGNEQLCPQRSVLLQIPEQDLWIFPPKQPPQVPEQVCPQFSRVLQGCGQGVVSGLWKHFAGAI